MAHDLAPSGRELCSQSTISRLENLPDVQALLRMGRVMVDLYCASFKQAPKRIVLDVDDTFDVVHGGQQLRLFNAHYDEYGFQPIVVFTARAASSQRCCVLPNGRKARRSAPFCGVSCARSAPTGQTQKSCCALIATTAVPRFSIGVEPTVSIILLELRPPRGLSNRQFIEVDMNATNEVLIPFVTGLSNRLLDSEIC
jgi:hypothetical protein